MPYLTLADPDPEIPGVVLDAICTGLREPMVRARVEPPLQEIVSWVNTTQERFYFGYLCQGSVTVARNFSRYVNHNYKYT